MKQLRFKFVVISSPLFVATHIPVANYMIKHKDKYSEQERYDYALKIEDHLRKRARTKTDVYGLENLPKDGGYIMYANHQGKYDALGIMLSHKKPCAMLWEEKSADRLVARQVCGLVEGTTIAFDNPKQQIAALNEIAERVKAGKPYLIFPEGKYEDNRNDLQEFKSGCFTASLKSKTPIVPVVIYDSWRAMDSNTFEKVTTQVHFLPQIPYEEYGTLRKKELCELVKIRIQEKLDQIKSEASGR